MASSTYNIFVVIWKFILSCTMSSIVSSSFCVVMSLVSVGRGINSSPISCIWDVCIHSKTYLMLANSFLILPLWFTSSSFSSIVWPFTLSMTRSTSSLVIVYFKICLWALAFLRSPPICMIGHLGGPISCGVVFNRVSYVVVSPLYFYLYTRASSLFPIYVSFFREFPFFYDGVFWSGFTCCVGFLVTTLTHADVLDGPTSTYFPFGISLVLTQIFLSSFQSLTSHSTPSGLMQNRSCSHYFIGSLCAWIHMFCHVNLNLAIPS